MTSRTPPGGGVRPPPRPPPPRRTLSGSSKALPRTSSHARSLSQQYPLPPSPIRRETFVDFGSEPSDGAGQHAGANGSGADGGRFGFTTTPRRAGSRLKLELSNESMAISDPSESAPDSDSRPTSAGRINSPNVLAISTMPRETSDVSDLSSAGPSLGHGQFDPDEKPFPMPKRQQRIIFPRLQRGNDPAPPPQAPVSRRDPRPKPYSLDVPAAAPRYPPAPKTTPSISITSKNEDDRMPRLTHGDFFPWTGEHPEDRFTDNVIKHGFFDKAPPSAPNETISAKATFNTTLKNKSGLSGLSLLFVNLMNQRRNGGQISAPSTFKPPPRVTLTDTKREVWMKDLANPAITLRKLSRTIPHGIRGKVLLDQCLSKGVPTDRAVWLARCVGANEIRASKRKGVNGLVMGGEAAWVREWTMNVERFVESVLASFGEPGWKAKVAYGIRLSAHLYFEQLVDRDHYTDWLITSLEDSTHARLPIWIVFVNLHLDDLLRLRKNARRLITALLTHLHTIYNDPDGDIVMQLSARLVILLSSLMIDTPESFVAPQTWSKFKDALYASLSLDDEEAQKAYRAIDMRNQRLDFARDTSRQTGRQELVKVLDSALQLSRSKEVSNQCLEASGDPTIILPTLLEWATSLTRPGPAKVYLAVRLMRSWAGSFDITGAILNFMDSAPMPRLAERKLLYHLVSELLRTDSFSVPRYTQWLIARGGLSGDADVDPDEGSCTTRLLAELPPRYLTPSMQSLRASLLRRANFNVEEERENIETALKYIKHALGIRMDTTDPISRKKPIALAKLCRLLGASSRVLQMEVGRWFNEKFFPDTDPTISIAKEGYGPSAATFAFTRACLEAADDYAMLAEFLKTVMRTRQADLLSFCADTINVHLQTFAGMGLATEFLGLLLTRYKSTREEQGLGARPFLAALASLAERIPGVESTATSLRRQLIEADRTSAIDVCSPLSDNMVAQMHDEDGDLHEQVEKLRPSTSSVDRQNMDKVFSAVVDRFEGCWEKPSGNNSPRLRVCSTWLTAMRAKDTQHFDLRIAQWVMRVVSLPVRPPLAETLPLLVSSGCLSLSLILASVGTEVPSSTAANPNNTSVAMQELLQMMMMPVVPAAGLAPEERCRFYIQQKIAQSRHPRELLWLIRDALVEYSTLGSRSAHPTLPLDSPLSQAKLADLLKDLTVADGKAVADVLGDRGLDSSSAQLIRTMIMNLLVPDCPVELSFRQVLELANELTLPFCQVLFSIRLQAADELAAPSEVASIHADDLPMEPQRTVFDAFAQAMDYAIETNNFIWQSVLISLSDEVNLRLKARAQMQLLELIPSAKMLRDDAMAGQATLLPENMLSVVEAFVRRGPPSRALQLTTAMVDKLQDLWDAMESGSREDEHYPSRFAVLRRWLPLLLALLALHTTHLEPPPAAASTPGPTTTTTPTAGGSVATPQVIVTMTARSGQPPDIRARLLVVLCGLVHELERSKPPEDPAVAGHLAERALDLAFVVVDSVSDESRALCAKILLVRPDGPMALSSTSTSSDPRLRYLFSYMPSSPENFMLGHKEKAPIRPGAIAWGMQQASQHQKSQQAAQQQQDQSGAATATSGAATGVAAATAGSAAAATVGPAVTANASKLIPFAIKRWEILNDFTPNVGENDTSLNIRLFDAIKLR